MLYYQNGVTMSNSGDDLYKVSYQSNGREIVNQFEEWQDAMNFLQTVVRNART